MLRNPRIGTSGCGEDWRTLVNMAGSTGGGALSIGSLSARQAAIALRLRLVPGRGAGADRRRVPCPQCRPAVRLCQTRIRT